MKTILSFLLLSFASTSFANSLIGNGGDVIYCPSPSPRAELLDFYEARVRRDTQIPTIPGNTHQEKLTALMDASAGRFPHLVNRLRREIADFERNVAFISGVTLVDIPDSNHIAIPTGCEIRQIAIQAPTQFPGEKYFTVSQDLWDLLDEQNRAGLILHEVLYRSALRKGAENSIAARYANASLFTGQLLTISDRDLFNLFQKIGVQEFEGIFPGGSYRFSTENYFPADDKVLFTPEGKFTGIRFYHLLDSLGSGRKLPPQKLIVTRGSKSWVLYYKTAGFDVTITPEGIRLHDLVFADADGWLTSERSATDLEWKNGQICFSRMENKWPSIEVRIDSPACVSEYPLGPTPSSEFVKLRWPDFLQRFTKISVTRKLSVSEFLDFMPGWLASGPEDERQMEFVFDNHEKLNSGSMAKIDIKIPGGRPLTYISGGHSMKVSRRFSGNIDENGQAVGRIVADIQGGFSTPIGIFQEASKIEFDQQNRIKYLAYWDRPASTHGPLTLLRASALTFFYEQNSMCGTASLGYLTAGDLLRVQNQNILASRWCLTFDLKIQSAIFNKDVRLRWADGRTKTIPKGKTVDFNPKGLVTGYR